MFADETGIKAGTMTDSTPYILSIEPVGERAFKYGFHLGTDLRMAKQIAVEKFEARNKAAADDSWRVDLDGHRLATQTVALLKGNNIVDVYDGQWSSEIDYDHWDD